jgi:hypothetical protein
MQEHWCRRLAILVAIWLVVTAVLQVAVALTLR